MQFLSTIIFTILFAYGVHANNQFTMDSKNVTKGHEQTYNVNVITKDDKTIGVKETIRVDEDYKVYSSVITTDRLSTENISRILNVNDPNKNRAEVLYRVNDANGNFISDAVIVLKMNENGSPTTTIQYGQQHGKKNGNADSNGNGVNQTTDVVSPLDDTSATNGENGVAPTAIPEPTNHADTLKTFVPFLAGMVSISYLFMF